jgi:preprotein translocase subunit SecG
MTAILLTINIIICAALVGLILLQRTDPSAGGMFGGTGGAGPAVRNPLAKPTAYLAAAFMLISLVIAYTSKGEGSHQSVTVGHETTGHETVPVTGEAPTEASGETDLLAPVQPQPQPAAPEQTLPEPASPAPAPVEAQ